MLSMDAYARVTLALDIIKKLDDGPYKGYHELYTIKHEIDLCDKVSITPSDERKIICDEPNVPLDENNLCWKAVDEIKKASGKTDDVEMIINKKIPSQGGLAGGSADAAAVIKLLNKLWNLGLSIEEMMVIGKNVGMDVPFCIMGGTALDAEGNSLPQSLRADIDLHLAIALPDIGSPTSQAYGNIDYLRIGKEKLLTDRCYQGQRWRKFDRSPA